MSFKDYLFVSYGELWWLLVGLEWLLKIHFAESLKTPVNMWYILSYKMQCIYI